MELSIDGVELWVESGKLRYRAPVGKLTDERVEQLRRRKSEILAFLDSRQVDALEPPLRPHDPDDPVRPLAIVQERFFSDYPGLEQPERQHVSRVVHLKGPLDTAAFHASMLDLFRRHRVLRTRYVQGADGPCAIVDDTVEPDVETIHLDVCDDGEMELKAKEIFVATAMPRFSFESGRLIRLRLVRLREEDHVLIIVMHHIISDVQSMRIVLEDIARFYLARLRQEPAELPDQPIQYGDFALWQRKMEESLGERFIEHWRKRLEGLPADPYWVPHDAHPSPNPSKQRYGDTTSPELFAGLRQAARRLHATPFSLALTAVCVLLARWTARNDILIQSLWSGRDRKELQDVIGCFAQMRLLRLRLSSGDTFGSAVKKAHLTLQEDMPYLKLPMLRLRERLFPSEDRPPEILVNYILSGGAFAYGHGDPGAEAMPEVRTIDWEVVPPLVDSTKWRLYFYLEEEAESLKWTIRFGGKYFNESTIEALSGDFHSLLEQVGAAPEIALGDIRLPRLGVGA